MATRRRTTVTPAEATPTPTPTEPVAEADAEEFDPEAVAHAQVADYIDSHRVHPGSLDIALQRHVRAVTMAGRAVPLDWYTRHALRDGGGPK